MNKIIPVFTFLLSLFGLFTAASGFILVLLSFSASIFVIFAVVLLVVSCIASALPVVGGVIFKSKLCRAAMVIGIISYALILIAFILLASI